MAIRFAGVSYEAIDMERIQPAEVDAIERATGMTFPKIRRAAEACVCEHGRKEHVHKDDAGEIDTADTSCTSCDCDRHESDLPTRVSTALMWVSIKRGKPDVTFKEVSEQALGDFADETPGESLDPTSPPQEAA